MLNKQNPAIYISYLWLFLAQLTTGVNITSSKYLLTQFDPMFLLFARFLIATIILFILHYIRKTTGFTIHKQKISELNKRDWKLIIIQALCAGVIFNYLLLIGLHYTDASSAGIITSTLPAVIAIMAIIFLGERLTIFTSLCVGFAITGLIVMNIDKFHSNLTSGMLGDLIILAAILPEATYYILAKIYNSDLPVFLLAGIINAINLIIAFIVLLILGHIPHDVLSMKNCLILFASGASSALFYTFWFLGCRNVSASSAGLFTTIMPISTLLLAWLFLGERISLLQLIGMSFVIASIVINAENPLRAKRKNPQTKLP